MTNAHAATCSSNDPSCFNQAACDCDEVAYDGDGLGPFKGFLVSIAIEAGVIIASIIFIWLCTI